MSKDKCNHVKEIWSIYAGGVWLERADGQGEDRDYDGYRCRYCPECGHLLEEGDVEGRGDN